MALLVVARSAPLLMSGKRKACGWYAVPTGMASRFYLLRLIDTPGLRKARCSAVKEELLPRHLDRADTRKEFLPVIS